MSERNSSMTESRDPSGTGDPATAFDGLSQPAYDRLMYGGLLGLSIVVPLEILGSGSIDLPLRFSLFAAAVAVPLLTGLLVSIQPEFIIDDISDTSPTMLVAAIAAPVLAVLSLCGVFWHFSPEIGKVFLAAAVYALWMNVPQNRKLAERAQRRLAHEDRDGKEA